MGDLRHEADRTRTLVLDVPGWPGHTPGQHVDVRLTAEDGYTAQRSYSIASRPAPDRLELTVEQLKDGEVSPYLVEEARPGDRFEVRGPIGGYFIWQQSDPGPVLLVAGGLGLVPLMSMIRARAAAGVPAPFALVYGTRSPEAAIYTEELARLAAENDGLMITYAYSRSVPPDFPRPPSRIDAELLMIAAGPVDPERTIYVCGSTRFVETMADLLVQQGHNPERIKTERFGATGG